ncbi:MAG: hypothetical protein R3A50_14920 [Saprospiraceae bacterium]
MQQRKPEIVTREIQDLDKMILSSSELLFQFPKDDLLRLNIEQLEHRKSELLKELEISLEFYGQHSLKYVFKSISDKIKLETLLGSLNTFKSLIDKTFEKVTGGKNNNLPIYFNTVFSGSYGIQLSTPFEEKLLDHDYEKAIDETLKVVGNLLVTDEGQLDEALNNHFGDDRKLISKYALFFKRIHESNEPVKIEWSSPISKQSREVTIEPEKAQFIHTFFSKKQISEETIELLGILKGLSLIRYRVEFVNDIEGKEYITAKFDESLSEEVIDSIDKYVIAQFNVSIKYNEAQDKEEKQYRLISIRPNK